jgi:zinc transporter, ZIP family
LSTVSALRKAVGTLIALLGLVLMVLDGAYVLRGLFSGPATFPVQFAEVMQSALPGLATDAVWRALAAGMMAAAATAAGTLPIVLFARISQRVCDAMLGFGAGVMLAATSFSLLLPALEVQQVASISAWQAASTVGAGLVVGALGLLLISIWMQQRQALQAQHLRSNAAAQTEQQAKQHIQRSWLFAAAIALHNVPEGLVIALALRSAGMGRGLAMGLGAASGLVEPLAAVVGALAIGTAAGLLPWGLALAAGAMLYAICHKAIPGAHANGNANTATVGLMFGFVLMMLLDTALV